MRKKAPRLLSERTARLVEFDLLRRAARSRARNQTIPAGIEKLHLGCQGKRIAGWLNVDVVDSDFDLDLACGRLPFPDDTFSFVVAQQTIEHLAIHEELIPLLCEVKRICLYGAQIWLSCPDMGRICRGYLADKGRQLLEGKRRRYGFD